MTRGRREETGELERLRAENRELDEQVKLLVQTEQRLYRSRGEADRQLARVRALSEFALRSSQSLDTGEILRGAVELLGEIFNIDCALALWQRVREPAIFCRFESDSDAPGCTGLEDAADAPDVRGLGDRPRFLEIGPGGAPPDIASLTAVFARGSPPSRGVSAGDLVVLVPLRWESGDGRGLLAMCMRGGRPPSHFLEIPAEDHLPYLRLLGSHVEQALHTAVLTRDLRARSDELEESNRKLRTSLDRLETAQRQLLQASKLEAVGRLAGGVAHDFNNILTVIHSSAVLLREDPDRGESTEGEIENIIRSSDRAAELTRQLLAFGRQQERRPETLDLNEVIRDAGKMLRRLISEDIELEFDLTDGIGAVSADRGQLEQVLLNLVANARDALPRGGAVTIATKSREREQDGSADHAEPAGGVVLTVTDDGLGMDESTRARAFEPFFTTKEVGRGSGMGLAMVYGIVKQSGCDIEVKSAPGKGSTFEIRLPVTVEPPRRPAGRVSRTPRRARQGSILVVEDEDAIRKLMDTILTLEGYTVRTATNGETALRLCEDAAAMPDLLITDVVMPRMGGVELVERLRKLRQGLRTLYVSGYSGEALSNKGLSSVPADFLQKPFTPEELVSKVAEAMDRPPGS